MSPIPALSCIPQKPIEKISRSKGLRPCPPGRAWVSELRAFLSSFLGSESLTRGRHTHFQYKPNSQGPAGAASPHPSPGQKFLQEGHLQTPRPMCLPAGPMALDPRGEPSLPGKLLQPSGTVPSSCGIVRSQAHGQGERFLLGMTQLMSLLLGATGIQVGFLSWYPTLFPSSSQHEWQGATCSVTSGLRVCRETPITQLPLPPDCPSRKPTEYRPPTLAGRASAGAPLRGCLGTPLTALLLRKSWF